MRTQIYKQCLIVPRGGKIFVYDIAGRNYAEVKSLKHAMEVIDARMKHLPVKKNPSSESESNAIAGRQWSIKPYIFYYVSELPGEGGVDWGYTTKSEQAIVLSPYWQRRFNHDMQAVNTSAKFISTSRPAHIRKGDIIKKQKSNPRIMKWPTFRVLMKQGNDYFVFEERRKGKKVYVWGNGPLRDEDIKRWKDLYCGWFTDYSSIVEIPGTVVSNTSEPILNPPTFAKASAGKPVEIYDRVQEIIAVKGPGHLCDAACKRARHTYRHKFTKKHKIYGNKNGSLTIR